MTCDTYDNQLAGQVEIFKNATKTASDRSVQIQIEIAEAESKLAALESTTTENALMGTRIYTGSFTTTSMWSTSTTSYSKTEVNCSQVLDVTKPTLHELFNSPNIIFNSNNTENVMGMIIRGDTVQRVLGFGTNSPQPIEIKCCNSEGKRGV